MRDLFDEDADVRSHLAAFGPAALAELRRVLDAPSAYRTEVLRALTGQHPATAEQLFGPDGDLNRYVNVYLNDEDVRVLDGLDTAVSNGDTVVILPAMAGGR